MAAARKPEKVQIVGSSKFGIHPKISAEKTLNMFISDGWLINYPGYKILNEAIAGNEGRGAFLSIRGGFAIAVIDDKVYKINASWGAQRVDNLGGGSGLRTRFGEVSIDENLSSQICIVDGEKAYIYNYTNNTFTEQTLTVPAGTLTPGYVCYHNSFFLIAPSENDPNNTNNWYAFQRSTDTTITLVTNSVFPLQSKPDKCLAIQRLPGKGNHVLALGESSCNVYTNVGGEQNYRRSSSFNIDYGVVSKNTIASNDEYVCFIGKNEKNTPTLIVTDGASKKQVSTDGIDNLFQSIQEPELSTAVFLEQNGHLFYQFTFYGDNDNISLAYDLKEDKFYHVSDAKFDYHPARQVIYFNNTMIFVGLNRGAIYRFDINLDGAYETLDSNEGETIPRVRVTNTTRNPSSKPWRGRRLSFWMEQGVTSFPKAHIGEEICVNYMITEDGDTMLTEDGDIMLAEDGYCSFEPDRPRVDLSISRNGGQNFSNQVSYYLNAEGVYQNEIDWFRLGRANEMTFQLHFWGLNRFLANNGVLEFY